MPFIDLLNEKCDVINLSSIDYRLLHSMGMENWYHPTGSTESLQGVNKMWNLLTNRSTGKYENIEVAQGRMIGCDKAAKNVGEFTFA
jgi:predicted ATPase